MNFTIQTERLILRQPTLNDAFEFNLLMSNPSLTTFLSWEAHVNIETTINLISSLISSQENDKGYHWTVCNDREIIGLVSLIDVRRKARTWTLNRAELSYWIGPSFQGKGYATEASSAIVKFGFSDLGLHKIIVAHAAENLESEKICKKLHFTKYAYERDAFYKNDKWFDLVWYELIKEHNED